MPRKRTARQAAASRRNGKANKGKGGAPREMDAAGNPIKRKKETVSNPERFGPGSQSSHGIKAISGTKIHGKKLRKVRSSE
jgi:hypothetical protein